MNGVDPAPQDVSFENGLFSDHKVKVFVYNQQVTDSLTESFLAARSAAGIPVVGVYETMPTPGYDYQSLDARRGRGAASGPSRTASRRRSCEHRRRRPALDGSRRCGVTVRLGGRTILDDVSFASAPASSPG